MKLIKPNYSQRSPIVNSNHFDDSAVVTGHPPLGTPDLGSPQDTFNPSGAGAGSFANGPPKYVQPKGKRVMAKGLTNKRLTGNI